MKRLLLPLLAALVFPTSLEAFFWEPNNFVINCEGKLLDNKNTWFDQWIFSKDSDYVTLRQGSAFEEFLKSGDDSVISKLEYPQYPLIRTDKEYKIYVTLLEPDSDLEGLRLIKIFNKKDVSKVTSITQETTSKFAPWITKPSSTELHFYRCKKK